MSPSVSIIMNCYNGERFLREAIESAFLQTYHNWELIFWDNASTDCTAKIAQSYTSDPRFKYYRAAITTPLGPARNFALQRAAGDYISFLDSDDVYLRDTIQRQVDLFQNGRYGMVYGGAVIIDENSREIERHRPRHHSGRIFGNLLGKYEVAMVAASLNRHVLLDEGLGFNEAMEYSPDFDLFMRVAAKYPVGVIPEVIVKNRRSSNSLTSRTLHLMSKEVSYTLDELERAYPQEVSRCRHGMRRARERVHLYEAINQICSGNVSGARNTIRNVALRHWKYFALFVLLHLPIRREWFVRRLCT